MQFDVEKAKRVGDRRYLKHLREVLQDLFAVANEVHGWSTQQMATNCGLSYATIWRLENGFTVLPRYQTLHKIARRLNFTIEFNYDGKRIAILPAA